MRSTEHMGDNLLSRLLDYLIARRAFEVAVDQARRQGWPDEEIYRVTGLSPHSAEAVLGRRQDPAPKEPARLDGHVAA